MENNPFTIRKHIEIKEYILSYKSQLENDCFSYRCKLRIKCKFTIKVSKKELEKFNNDNNYSMDYEITNKVTANSCKIKNDKENHEIKNFDLSEKKFLKNKKLKKKQKIEYFEILQRLYHFIFQISKTII